MALTAQEEALVRQLLDEQAAILSLAGSEATILSKLGATKVTLSDLTPVSTVADADLLLMRQGSTDKSLSALILSSYAVSAVPSASETVQGKIELATNAEVQTGTDAVRAVTPAGLTSRTATDIRTGVVELATNAEAQAGTDTTRSVTPANLGATVIGIGQTWQTVTRVSGTTYTNTTGRSIFLQLNTVSTGGGSGISSIVINGGTSINICIGPTNGAGSGGILIPPGSTYVITDNANISTRSSFELR